MPVLVIIPIILKILPLGVVVVEAGGGGHGGGGPKGRVEIIRALSRAELGVSSGSRHAALAFETHEEKPSLS
ncbi:MAG: hypothetical protein JST04_00105 [Bdellovibrionales bacterium]|nr:hypothetical protein [Bdellovibrionales bacterium]